MPFFLSRSLLVQRNKTDEDVVVAEAGRPAISFGNGGIEFIVQFLQDQHEATVEDTPVCVVECCGCGSRTQLLQDIVEAGQCQVRMLRQHALAKRVELFGKTIDGDTLSICAIRKRKGRENILP